MQISLVVASALVKNVSSFSSNSDDRLISRAFVAIYKTNCNPKFNLVFDHSKSHISPVFVEPVSVPNFCISSTISSSSYAVVQKPSFESYSFKSSSFVNFASKCSFCHSKFSSSKIPTTPKSPVSVSPKDCNNCSFSIPSVIKSNDSKPASTPSQTSPLSHLPIKSSKCLFKSSTQAC